MARIGGRRSVYRNLIGDQTGEEARLACSQTLGRRKTLPKAGNVGAFGEDVVIIRLHRIENGAVEIGSRTYGEAPVFG